MFVATLVAIPLIVVRIPADYFTRDDAAVTPWLDRHPSIRLALVLSKNLLGVVLVLAGIAMLVLPGQGILTILFGIMLLDLPWKRDVELWLVQRRGVSKAINWLRKKYDRPPLEMPGDSESGSETQ